MRIAFAGTPLFAARQCEALLNTDHQVVVVYTQPDKPAGRGQHLQESAVKILAKAHQIPIEQPARLTDDAIEIFKQYKPDVMVVAAYGLLLPAKCLQVPPLGCINVHASLLPRWRGAAPIQRAILTGDSETGITLMRMDVGLDTGNMLIKKSCPITNTDTSETLHDTLAALGAQLLASSLDQIVQQMGEVQDETLATYARKISKEEGNINWHSPAVVIDRQIRAFVPWPVAFTQIDQETLRIWQATVVTTQTHATPGTIIEHRKEGIIVATTKDALLITQAQLPGKKRLPFSDILHAHQPLFKIGKSFGSQDTERAEERPRSS
jgi:methionyl-tRNA formyltransferase